MTMSDPSRLRATVLTPGLREALRELPHGDPTPAQLGELRARLGIGAPSQVSRRSKTQRLRRTAGILVLFPIAAAAATGVFIELTEAPAPHGSAVEERSQPRQSAQRARTAPQSRALPSALAEPNPVPDLPLAAPAATARTSSTAEPLARAARVDGIPAVDPSSRTSPQAVVPQATFEPLSTAPARAVSLEVELLQRANAALKDRPAQALALTEQHQRQFPNGNLAQERDVIAIKALVAQAQLERARAKLLSFERAYPRSVHVLELRQIIH